MKMIRLTLLFVALVTVLHAQGPSSDLLNKPWKAQWITGPGDAINIWSGVVPESQKQHIVLKFRKSFELNSKPSSFIVNVSADNRYKLYVNGMLVSLGPARGDLFNWNFETVDIAQHLVAGKNVIAALVWNEGPMRPEAQVSLQTGFILAGNSLNEELVNTNESWKVVRDEGYEPLRPKTMGYYVAGQGELIRVGKTIRGWELSSFDDSAWKSPRQLGAGVPKGVFTFAPVNWMLIPSPLPQMERTVMRMGSVRKAEGITVPSGFPKNKVAVTIPAHTKATLLIDNDVLTNAYACLSFSKGKEAGISIAYSEALYIRNKNENLNGYTVAHMPKGNRNEVDGKVFVGRRDSLISDGSNDQLFTTLWYRTYRYVLVKIATADEPLVLNDIYGIFTGYPFQMASKLETTDQSLHKNVEIGWRTARLCATETYMDCPYYEQLQYFGDTRIQCLVTLFNSNDDRLVRNAITMADRSRLAEGVTMSRYPTASTQIIPPFSLWWIGMVHDYWRYRNDEEFVKNQLAGTRAVLNFFQKYQQQNGSLKNLPYWIFTDWVDGKGWKDGVAPLGAAGNSSVLDIQLLWTYQLASDLEMSLGLKDLANEYRRRADQLRATVKATYWDSSKGLFADTPEKDVFSQHPNALAILCGLVEGSEAKSVATNMMKDQTLSQASIYFKYYLHLAEIKAGVTNDYIKLLDKWNENVAMGLTTWAEMSDVAGSRSDCHAWGSSPNVEFFRTVLGIDSDAAGFKQVRIEPHLGEIKEIGGTIPHPAGNLHVQYSNVKGKWKMTIDLPSGVTGKFVWAGKEQSLKEGHNVLDL